MPSLRTRQSYENLRVAALRLSDAIDASWTDPSLVLSSSAGSSSATITVAAHSRRYPDRIVSIPSTTFSNKALGAEFALYYDDLTRLSTRSTIAATTNLAIAANNYVVGRHFLGTITTPTTAGGSASGGTFPSGGGGEYAIP